MLIEMHQVIQMVISAVHKSCNSYIDRGAYDNIATFQDFFPLLTTAPYLDYPLFWASDKSGDPFTMPTGLPEHCVNI